jgi:thioredoxin reductase (NADPH)
MTAAIQLKRSGFEPVLIEKDRVGGALLNAGWVENYPGFPEGISGIELADHFRRHLRQFDVSVHELRVAELKWHNDQFTAICDNGEITAEAAVVASGAVPLHLGIEGEAELSGNFVFHELRDLPERTAGKACIIGGGDAAFDYALSLARRGVDVVIGMRSKRPRCLQLLADRVSADARIEVIPGISPQKFVLDNDSCAVYFNEPVIEPLTCDIVLVAVGRKPETSFLEPGLSDNGDANRMLYFAGDVVNGSFRQVGIAVGDGLRCAMDIAAKLEKPG